VASIIIDLLVLSQIRFTQEKGLWRTLGNILWQGSGRGRDARFAPGGITGVSFSLTAGVQDFYNEHI